MQNTFTSLEALKEYCGKENVNIGFSDNTDVYRKSHDINGHHAANSLAVLPMEGCDSMPDGSPGELTARRYRRLSEGGAGIVWVEATAVVEEGRAFPWQLYINTKNTDLFKRMVEESKEAALRKNGYAPLCILQLTHSGRYAKPQGVPAPVLAAHNPVLDEKYHISPDYPLITDQELKELEDRYAEAALLAQNAGFDGVDIKACHGYLISELLAAHTREGEYGGDFAGRTRFIRNTTGKIRQTVSPDMILSTRLSIYDAMEYPYGFGVDRQTGGPDLTEPASLLNDLYGRGVRMCAVTMGNPYLIPHVNRPFDKGAYESPEPPVKGVERLITLAAKLKRMVPKMTVIGAGYSWLREFAVQAGAYTLEQNGADMIGFGRQVFANPEFANDILKNGRIASNQTCMTCSKCSELMRSMVTAGCVVRDSRIYAPLYAKHIRNKEEGK